MKLSAPYSVLKRRAKLRSRNEGIPLNKALDQIANCEGFKNWSLLAERTNPSSFDQPITYGDSQISELPLLAADRKEFVELAEVTFRDVLDRIESNNPNATLELWNAEDYIDNHLLQQDMLPIDRDYALSLVEAFMVHHVIPLAIQADELASQ